MYKFEKSVFIQRAQQEVFDFVSDPANEPQWQSGGGSSEWTSEGPVGVGSTQRSTTKFLGREIESTIEITVWDPPNEYTQKVLSGPVPFEANMKFEPKEDGTQIILSGQAEFGGFFKLAEGLVGKQLEKQLDNDLKSLKELLEGI